MLASPDWFQVLQEKNSPYWTTEEFPNFAMSPWLEQISEAVNSLCQPGSDSVRKGVRDRLLADVQNKTRHFRISMYTSGDLVLPEHLGNHPCLVFRSPTLTVFAMFFHRLDFEDVQMFCHHLTLTSTKEDFKGVSLRALIVTRRVARADLPVCTENGISVIEME